MLTPAEVLYSFLAYSSPNETHLDMGLISFLRRMIKADHNNAPFSRLTQTVTMNVHPRQKIFNWRPEIVKFKIIRSNNNNRLTIDFEEGEKKHYFT